MFFFQSYFTTKLIVLYLTVNTWQKIQMSLQLRDNNYNKVLNNADRSCVRVCKFTCTCLNASQPMCQHGCACFYQSTLRALLYPFHFVCEWI